MIRIKASAKQRVTRVTPVTAVTITRVPGITHCPTCGQKLPALTKTAAKQKAYRERKRAAR